MATIFCPNPQCQASASLPDEHLGRRVTCRTCGTKFVAGDLAAVQTASALPIIQSGSTTTDTAQRRSKSEQYPPHLRRTTPSGSVGWLMVAVLAFVLPIAGASAFLLLKSSEKSLSDGSGASQLHGGIEIGSSGVKLTLVELVPSAEFGIDYAVKLKDSIDTKIISGMDKEGNFDPQALKDTVHAVKTYYNEMRQQWKLPSHNIYIVGGSGIFKGIRDRDDLDVEGKNELIIRSATALRSAVKAATGENVDFIDPRKEVELQIFGLVPKKYWNTSVLVDIGSGGSRGGYRKRIGSVTFESLGIKQYEKLVKEKGNKAIGFAVAARDLASEELCKPLQKIVDRQVGLRQQPRVYLNGGISWVMTTFQHPDKLQGNYVKLTAQDIEDFANLVRRNPNDFPQIDLPSGMSEEARKKVEQEVSIMRKIFKPERLIAGAEVLRALSKEMRWSNKELYFTRDGQIAWLLGYIALQNLPEK